MTSFHRQKSARIGARTHTKLNLESLEERRLLTTVVVVNTTDDVVDSNDSFTSLREAIIQANNTGGDFEIQLGEDTYNLTIQGYSEDDAEEGDLDILDSGEIKIVGAGMNETTILADDEFGDRIFDVLTDASLNLQDLTVRGGTAPNVFSEADGGGIRNLGSLDLLNVKVSHSTALFGGGIANYSELNITDSMLWDNETEDDGAGGALYNAGVAAIATISGSQFLLNAGHGASTGGAIYNGDTPSLPNYVGTLTLEDCTFHDNSATLGAAIANIGELEITDCIFYDNTAEYHGGAIETGGEDPLTITRTTFSGNVAGGVGGALKISEGLDVTIVDSTFSENVSEQDDTLFKEIGGGAIFANTSQVFISGSTFVGNSATSNGGAITNFSYFENAMHIVNSTFSGNMASINGGAINSVSGGMDLPSLLIEHSTITGNRADADNQGGGAGGGLYVYESGSLQDLALLKHTIVAGNMGTSNANSDIEQFVSGLIDEDSEYNLIGDPNTAGGLTNGVNGNILGDGMGNVLSIATILDTDLSDNGGPTETHALVYGSPAIDAGDSNFTSPPDYDQRGTGFPRVLGNRIDIGAFEFEFTSSVPTGGRHIFYNQSYFDGNDAAANADDSDAIATDKSAYLPGDGLITQDSVTSYFRGVNGIMVDLEGTHGTISASDFILRVSDFAANNTPSTWASAPTPATINVLSDTPTAGTDRVEIIWSHGDIVNRYLEVTVKGNDSTGGFNTNTGLAESDIFYFGNIIGDVFVNDPAGGFATTSTDEALILAAGISAAPITSLYDIDRNGAQGLASDQAYSRANAITGLLKINISDPPAAPEAAPATLVAEGAGSAVASALALRGMARASALLPPTVPSEIATASFDALPARLRRSENALHAVAPGRVGRLDAQRVNLALGDEAVDWVLDDLEDIARLRFAS